MFFDSKTSLDPIPMRFWNLTVPATTGRRSERSDRTERPRRGREDDRSPRPGRSSSLEIGDDDIDIPAFLR